MLRSLKDLERYVVHATDGDIGEVTDFLVDDEQWVVRYLVVRLGSLFNERLVLISPVAFGKADWNSKRFHVELTTAKVTASPDIDVHLPVNRQRERDLSNYYGYPFYGDYSGVWGSGAYPQMLAMQDAPHQKRSVEPDPDDVHLRSAREIRGYAIQGSDEPIGHVDDFVVNDHSWEVRYFVIDTATWWFGQKVLVAPHWAIRTSWEEQKVFIALSRSTIQGSPVWDPNAPVNREYESRLYDYYGRPVYWGGGEPPNVPGTHDPL